MFSNTDKSGMRKISVIIKPSHFGIKTNINFLKNEFTAIFFT